MWVSPLEVENRIPTPPLAHNWLQITPQCCSVFSWGRFPSHVCKHRKSDLRSAAKKLWCADSIDNTISSLLPILRASWMQM